MPIPAYAGIAVVAASQSHAASSERKSISRWIQKGVGLPLRADFDELQDKRHE